MVDKIEIIFICDPLMAPRDLREITVPRPVFKSRAISSLKQFVSNFFFNFYRFLSRLVYAALFHSSRASMYVYANRPHNISLGQYLYTREHAAELELLRRRIKFVHNKQFIDSPNRYCTIPNNDHSIHPNEIDRKTHCSDISGRSWRNSENVM